MYNDDIIKTKHHSINFFTLILNFSIESQKLVFTVANAMKWHGEKYSWFAGTMVNLHNAF